MKYFRPALMFTINFVFRTSLFFGLTLLGFNLLLSKPSYIKDVLNEINAYSRFDSVIIDSLKSSPQSINSLPLDDPNVLSSINKNFNEKTFQNISETFIDSLYDWLNNKTNTVEFDVDLTQNKQNLASEISQYSIERLSGLPICTNQPTDTDVFKVECQPYNADYPAIKDQIYTSILTDKNFLPTGHITLDNLPKVDSNKVFVDVYPNAPNYFKLFKLLPYLLLAISLICGYIILIMSKTKIRGLINVGYSIFSNGIILAVAPVLYVYILPIFGFKLPSFNGTNDSASVIVNDAISKFYSDTNIMLINISIQTIVVGLVVLFIGKFLRKNTSVYTNLERKTGLSTSEKKITRLFSTLRNVPLQTSEGPKKSRKKISKFEKKYRKM